MKGVETIITSKILMAHDSSNLRDHFDSGYVTVENSATLSDGDR